MGEDSSVKYIIQLLETFALYYVRVAAEVQCPVLVSSGSL